MPPLRSPFSAYTDTLLRILGPLVLFTTGMLFFRLKMYLETPLYLLKNLLITALFCGYTGWELNRLTSLYIQKRLPGLNRITARILWLVLALLVLSHIGYAMRRTGHIILDREPWKWPTLLDYSATMGVVIFYTTVTLGIYEAAYLWKQWKQTFAEKEKLIQQEWENRYDLLKAQINPHFLFNSLNSLSSLIAENPVQAEKFTDEMSRVYRYLLRNNDQEVVTLSTELQFIRSYGHLLKTRHGGGFNLNLQVEEEHLQAQLPSLTLQLLVENAVKHNIVDKEQPLHVIIKTNSSNQLIVENNKQKKSITVKSTGIGLNNIREKFQLLSRETIEIQETETCFRVIIPLAKNEATQHP